MSGTTEPTSAPLPRRGGGAAPAVHTGGATSTAGGRIEVDHTGEILTLRLTDDSLTAGHDAVAKEVVDMYRQALATALTTGTAGGNLPARGTG